MKVPSNSVDEFVFAMSGQYLFDPNERNTWGALGPYDLSNTQDIGNSGAATFIHTVGGLSAHADQQGMVDWYRSFENSPPALLVHGERKAMDALSTRLKNECNATAIPAKRGKSTNLLALDTFGR